MSEWLSPAPEALEEVVATAEGHLILCSPYIKSRALNVVAGALPATVSSIEVWTKLSLRDWLTGASEPEELLDFLDQVESQGTKASTTMRSGDKLHAKMIISDGPKAMAGSANLTAGGYFHNVEVARLVDGSETAELRTVANKIRPELRRVKRDEFTTFVSMCLEQAKTQEALIDLILEEAPERDDSSRTGLISFGAFKDYLRDSPRPLAAATLRIADNSDKNNNTGKVKQGFFGVQRFLQEYPQHQSFVEHLPDTQWFEVQDSHLWDDWQRFLHDFREERDEDLRYDISTLMGYLTPSSGGTRRGGGGGDNELKRVWPFVGRITRSG